MKNRSRRPRYSETRETKIERRRTLERVRRGSTGKDEEQKGMRRRSIRPSSLAQLARKYPRWRLNSSGA